MIHGTDSLDDSLLEETGGFSSAATKVLNFLLIVVIQLSKTLTSGRRYARDSHLIKDLIYC